MVELKFKIPEGDDYDTLRDEICRALVGNRAFIENDIIVSDEYKDEDAICICLGDENNGHWTHLEGNITDALFGIDV